MIGKFFNLTVVAKITTFAIVMIVAATVAVSILRVEQVRDQSETLITERLQANSNATFGVFRSILTTYEWILGIAENYAQQGLMGGTDISRDLSHIFEFSMREMLANGQLVNENLIVFDREFNIVAVANPLGDTVDLAMLHETYWQESISEQVWISPAFTNTESGRMQLLFAKPIVADDNVLGYVGMIGNMGSFQYYLQDFMRAYEGMYDYDSFVNLIDGSGTIFFSTRPEAYKGRHVDDLGVYEAFGEIPMNTLIEHHSALTGIDKLAYITTDPTLGWTLVSFFDAHAVEDTAWLVFITLMPIILGIIIAGAFIIFVIHRSLKPLKGLALSAKAVAKGNMDVSFDVDKIDEIGQVSSSFLEIVTALHILGNNFKNAEKAMMRGDTEYSLSDSKIGGIFDEMLDSTNNIIMQIQSSMLEAKHNSEAKSKFLATMSHEIRTPMNAILGITQMQMQKGSLTKEESEAFQKIYSSGSTLLGIINDILDMSKIESGKLEVSSVEYDVPSLIYDTVQLNIIRIGYKAIEFILELDEDLPSRLYGDELRIKQILNNFLSNAIKYTDKGHVKFSIKAFPEGEVTILQFVFEDTGQGMKKEDLEQLFSEYTRFNMDSNRSVEGTGIGLTIADNLIKLMDGTIEVESEYMKGTTFTVKIKQKTVECPPIGATLAEQLCNFSFMQDSTNMQMVYQPMPYGSVLVVDDMETNLYVAEGLLSPYKLTIEKASSGIAAIEKIKSGKVYDVVFMDHMMPDMDGIETTQRLRALGYTGSIVALTANALVGNDEMFISKGFDGFISKPIDIRLMDRILVKHVRDKHPEESAKYKEETITQSVDTTSVHPRLISAFVRDAKGAVGTILKTLESGDISLLTITAHAMKAALANVREHEASAEAAALEDAGKQNDTEYVEVNTVKFAKKLESLIERYSALEAEAEADSGDSDDIIEDTEFLVLQMQKIQSACEDYDDQVAYEAIAKLLEKPWKAKTKAAIEEINETLRLKSDFEEAAELAQKFVT